jgi:WD40 repeat protein
LIGNPLQVRIIEKPIAAFRAKYRVEKMRFSSNGDLLLVNDKEIWHLASRRKLLFKQEKPDYMPLTADLSFDGKLLASSAFEFDEKSRESYAALRIWDIRSDGLDGLKRIKIQTKLGYGSDKWQTVRWSPRSNYLAACSNEVLIIIRDPLRGATEKMIVHPSLLTGEVNGLGRLLGTGFKHNVTGVAFSPDEKLLAVAFQNFGVHVFTLPDCQSQAVLSFDEPIERWEWNPEHPGWATQPVRFSDDGTLLATFQKHQQRRGEEAGGSGSTYSVKFWDTLSWKDLSTIPKKGMGDSNRELHAVGFLPGRSVYAAASVDKSILMTIWDARTAEAMASIRPFLLPNMGSAISISANGNAVLFNQGAGGLQVWDVAGSGPIARIDDKRLHDPRNASISPDANLVATGYPDGEVNLWDLSISGRTVTIEEMLIESEGATREHERQNSFLHRKAQPVTKRLFDQIKVGMTPIEVHKLLGGQPTTEETEVDRVSDHRGGKLRGGALITRFTEYYRGQGRDDAKVVLIFEGQGSGPPLVKKYQVGLD